MVTDRFFGRNKRTVDPADTSIHGGTLDGIVEKLDYLIELGVTTIWVTPVYENIERFGESEPYHYYWAQDFRRMDGRLLDGSQLPDAPDMSTFAAFVERCEVLFEGKEDIPTAIADRQAAFEIEHAVSLEHSFYWFSPTTRSLAVSVYGMPVL